MLRSWVGEYVESAKFPTYTGLLCYLGIFTREMLLIRQYAANGNEKYVAVLRVLDEFKQRMEQKMEEYLVYQFAHDDLKQVRHYNFTLLTWMLKCSNPRKYGGVEVGKDISVKNQVASIPSNESEVSLIELSAKSA